MYSDPMPSLRYALLALLLTGCSDGWVSTENQTCVEVRKDIPAQRYRNLDILLVVDSSPSMADEANILTDNLHRIANILETIDGGLPNVHIAVVSSDGSGTLQSTAQIAGCSPPDGDFIRDIVYANGERERNYIGELGDVLACIGALPASGSAIEQPLESMHRALQDDMGGFLREDAFLQVLILGDEDDCSGGESLAVDASEANTAWRCLADGARCDQVLDTPGSKTGCEALEMPATLTPLSEYETALKSLRADPGQILVASLTSGGAIEVVDTAQGPGLVSACPDRSARAMPRLDAFRSFFPNRNDSVDVCADDWGETLVTLATPLATTTPHHCISNTVDLDAAEDGVQHECVVTQIRFGGTDSQEEFLIPECLTSDGEGETPCWRIEEEALCTLPQQGLGARVLRGRENIPSGTSVSFRCHAGCLE